MVRSEFARKVLPWLAMAVIAGAALGAHALAPWFDAAPVPVQLVLDAPDDTSLRISWEEDRSSAVPLICQTAGDSPAGAGTADRHVWLGELPPRPAYQLAILFDSPVHGVLLRELTLVNIRDLQSPVFQWNARDPAIPSESDGIHLETTGAGIVLESDSAGRLSLTLPIACSSRSRPGVFVILWIVVSGSLFMTGLAGVAFLREALAARTRADDRHPARCAKAGLMPIGIAVGLGFILHMGVAAGIPAIYNAFDPLAYFHKAVWLAERGTYITETPSWEIDRLPGYPLFLAACLKLFGYQLQLIVLTQGLLFTLALAALAVALRHWLRPVYSAAAVLVLLASPVSLQHTLSIGTEGLFATCAIFALAAFIEHLGASRRASIWWMTGCGAAIVAATLIRPNGIVLLAMPLAAWGPQAIRSTLIPGRWTNRLRSLTAVTWPYAIPAALLVVVLGGWTIRNGWQHGLYAPSSMVGVSIVEGQFQAGTFDARALNEVGLYEDYVRDHPSEEYCYSGWRVRGSLCHRMSPGGKEFPPGFIPALDQQMKRIGARSDALAPWQLRIAGLLRTFLRGLILPASRSYTRTTIWSSPYFHGNHPNATAAWKRFCNEDAIARLGKPLPLRELDDETPKTGWAVDYLRWPDAWHRWAYRGFLVASLVLFPVLLWRGEILSTGPILVFLTNVVLNTWLLNMQGRYLMPLEFTLVFQTMIGLDLLLRGSLWRRAGQPDATDANPAGVAMNAADQPCSARIAA